MYGLYPLQAINGESGEHLTGKAQTLAEIQADALLEDAEDFAANWQEPRNEC